MKPNKSSFFFLWHDQFVDEDITPIVERNSVFKAFLSKIGKHAAPVTFAGFQYEWYQNED